MSMNFEDTVATAIIDELSKSEDADLVAAVGYIFQEPLDDRAKALRDRIGVVAIHAVAQWNLKYSARAVADKD